VLQAVHQSNQDGVMEAIRRVQDGASQQASVENLANLSQGTGLGRAIFNEGEGSLTQQLNAAGQVVGGPTRGKSLQFVTPNTVRFSLAHNFKARVPNQGRRARKSSVIPYIAVGAFPGDTVQNGSVDDRSLPSVLERGSDRRMPSFRGRDPIGERSQC